jgi:hypothetical protein
MKDKPKNEDDFDFAQLGSVDRDEIFLTTRAFWLQTKLGPLEVVSIGSRVRVSSKTARELFQASKIEPIEIPKMFEVVHPFVSTNGGGEWLEVEIGDTVQLERKLEALKFWRCGWVKPSQKKEAKKL